MMKKIFFFLILGCGMIGENLNAQKVPIDNVVAVVGDKIILQSEVETQYALYLKEGNPANEEMKCSILGQMMGQKLLVAQAEIDSLTDKLPTFPAQVEAEVQKRIDYYLQSGYFSSRQELEEFYGKSLIQIKEEFRPLVADQLKAQMVQQNITMDIDVSPADVRRFYNSMPKDSLPLFSTQVEIGQIVVQPEVTDAQKLVARTKLENIRAQVKNGESFKQLAILNSDDPGSAYSGGDLGFINRNQPFDPAFKEVAFRLKVGELSQIFESEYGFHIIECLERKGEQIHIRHILIIPEKTQEEVDAAVAKLDTIRKNIIADKITFAEAAALHSDDKATRGSGGMFMANQSVSLFSLENINNVTHDPGVFPVIDSMDVGQISKPIVMENPQTRAKEVRIIYFKSKVEPHRASLEKDYPRLRNYAMNMKQQEKVQEWFADKIKNQYIRLDESYQDCPPLKRWAEAANKF